MKNATQSLDRRKFIKTAALSTGLVAMNAMCNPAMSTPNADSLYVIGPTEGYSPHIGVLVSMLNYNRSTIIEMIKPLTKEKLDHLHDKNANTIGALVLHLGATDKFYQINTFEGRQEFNAEEKKVWEAPMTLGDLGRQTIKGHDAKYYLDAIGEVREKTLELLKEKDDAWLLAVDPAWSSRAQLNTYWKWFHVCEHESNHRGQIAFLLGRLPGATPGKD